MNQRPWQVSAIVFLVLTLLYWSDFKADLTFRGFPLQAYLPQTHTASAIQNSPVNNNIESPFPKVDTSKPPKTNLTVILLGNDAKKMQNAIIPKENSASPYGLKFNLQTFNQMKSWDKLNVDTSNKDRFTTIISNAFHPCCGSTIDTTKCSCGHAVGMEGLVKKMLQDGKSNDEINNELMLWGKYFFPRHYVIVALALQKMGQSPDKINLGPDYSSAQVEGPAGNFLIYN